MVQGFEWFHYKPEYICIGFSYPLLDTLVQLQRRTDYMSAPQRGTLHHKVHLMCTSEVSLCNTCNWYPLDCTMLRSLCISHYCFFVITFKLGKMIAAMSVKITDAQHFSDPTHYGYLLFPLLLCLSYINKRKRSTANYSDAEKNLHHRSFWQSNYRENQALCPTIFSQGLNLSPVLEAWEQSPVTYFYTTQPTFLYGFGLMELLHIAAVVRYATSEINHNLLCLWLAGTQNSHD